MMFGSHCVKSWSVTQSVISLSSGEAEYYAMVKGATVAFWDSGACLGEVGLKLHVRLKCDASAAVGIVMRKGLGKVKHIEVTQVWLQEKVAEGLISVMKVGAKENVSGGLTKGVSGSEVEWMMSAANQVAIQ